MKYILLIPIRLYWRMGFLRRRCCLFHESCSRYVYRKTLEGGLIVGLKALHQRISQCRPGYIMQTEPDGSWTCCLADGTILPEKELASHMIPTLSFSHAYPNINQDKQR